MSLRAQPLRFAALFTLLAPATALGQTAPAAPAPPAAGVGVKTVEFEAPSVGRKMKYNIALPRRYAETDDRYPVLYLLHGLTSNYTAWARLGAGRAGRAYDLIVVMPDVGNSWYANWAESESGQKNAWEDFIITDLIGHVDSTYRTLARREGRAINGLSMGGYGGLMLGLKHPDMFCSVGSHSGAVAFAKGAANRLRSGEDLARLKGNRTPSETPNPDIGIEGFSSQAERTPKGKLFTKPEEADAYDPFKLVLAVPKERLPHIYVDCGTDDRLLKSNQDFVKLLMDNKIPFTYAESGGGHVPAYWSREVGHSMAVQYQIIRRNLAKVEAETH
jgi:S-formylglutathione hydrolase FrmB